MVRFVLWCTVLVACEHGSGGGLPGTDGGGSGRSCGGFAGQTCGTRELCDFPLNSCGNADQLGTCTARPDACPDLFDPVCGCDGTVYSSQCDAAQAGVDVDASGSCRLPGGTFACGFKQCDLATQYCQRAASDVGGEPDGFACMPLPVGCGSTPTCGCLANEPCSELCSGDATSGLQLTCPGG